MEIKGETGKKIFLQVGLYGAVLIDGLLNIPMFISISITPLIAVAFIGMAALAVLFKVFALYQNWRVTWFIFAAITFFGSTSMAVQETGKQTEFVEEAITSSEQIVDQEYNRLVEESKELYSSWQDLQRQFDAATRPETMDRLQKQIDPARELYESKDKERKERLALIEARQEQEAASKHRASADEVFLAIPNAARDGRIVPLVFFILLFLGLEAVIYAAITASKKEKDKESIVKEPDLPVFLEPTKQQEAVDEPENKEEAEDIKLPDEAIEQQPELQVIQDKIRPKSFIYFSWPKGKGLINKPELIADKIGVSKEEAVAFHKAFYDLKELKLEPFAKYFRPNMKREDFLKLRRERNGDK